MAHHTKRHRLRQIHVRQALHRCIFTPAPTLWIGIVFLLIQGISELLKSHYAMKNSKWPGDE